MDFEAALSRRLQPRPLGRWDVVSTLGHFALITYALPKERLARFIPQDRFDIPEYRIGGQARALMSAVPFLDIDFHFARLFSFVKFRFGQTNYRVYVRDRRTGEHVVWFFGTTLGSPVVYLPRWLWRIPWHQAAYDIGCRYDPDERRYAAFRYTTRSLWAASEIDVLDTGQAAGLAEGFESQAAQTLILTHPLDGYFRRLDGKLGHYCCWHEVMNLTTGRARHLYFSLYERLGLLTREEMQVPHSIFMCPEIEFQVFLPPAEVT